MTIIDILKQAHETKGFLEVHLLQGQHFRALVKSLDEELAVFSQLVGREFYEAYVPVMNILYVEKRIS